MERETARRVCNRLQTELGGHAKIDPYFWEHEVMVATKDYQQNIPELDSFDIVVCILWSRLGTPLDPERHPKPGGGGFASGTEYEFFTAMQAHQLHGTPDIFVFHNQTEPRRPSRPKDVREAFDREIDRLDAFFDTYFKDDEFFTRAINIYSTLSEFEDKLTLALQTYITAKLPKRAAISSARKITPTVEGSPYLGLTSFDYHDSNIFFGRTAETGQIISALQEQEIDALAVAGATKRFLLILGSSGSGKSSLARAGVLPMLTQPGVIEGSHAWRRAIFQPGEYDGDPVIALAHALSAPDALPELATDGITADELAGLIRQNHQGAGLLLRQALGQAGAQALIYEKQRLREKLHQFTAQHREADVANIAARIENLQPPTVRIALLADQLEELFTSDVAPDTLESFLHVLHALATSGRVFVIGTLRSDFYPQALAQPLLVELMRGSGTYHLPPPDAASVGQMIRRPAAAAGLQFEENAGTGESLDELLRDASLAEPAALPLLSYTLEQLYEARSPTGLLTLESYHQLGGLEGAIGSRAESVFSQQSDAAQSSFDDLCKVIITLGENGQPTRRRAPVSALQEQPSAALLADALVEARLLTAGVDADGTRTLSVAHEALFRHWPRVIDWVEKNRTFLITRTRVSTRMHDWIAHEKSPDYLIPRSPQLAHAEELLAAERSSLSISEAAFIAASSLHAKAAERARLRRARLTAAGAFVLSAVAIAAGAIATLKSREATRQSTIAQENAESALASEKAARAGRVETALALGTERLSSGRLREGLASLGQALAIDPTHKPTLARLYSELLYAEPTASAVASFYYDESTLRQRITGAIKGPRQYIATLSEEGAPLIIDLATLEEVLGPWSDEKRTIAPLVFYDSSHIVSLRDDFSLAVWDANTRDLVGTAQVPDQFADLAFIEDGRSFVTGYFDGRVEIREVDGGTVTHQWQHPSSIIALMSWKDRYCISTSATQTVIFDLHNSREIARLTPADGQHFRLVDVAYDEPVICIVSDNALAGHRQSTSTFNIIDLTTGRNISGNTSPTIPGQLFDVAISGDGQRILCAPAIGRPISFQWADTSTAVDFETSGQTLRCIFSPDDRLALASNSEGTVFIVDATTGQRLFSPVRHDGTLENLSMSWDGQFMLTSTATTSQIWDLSVSSALNLPVNLGSSPLHSITPQAGGLTIRRDRSIDSIDPRIDATHTTAIASPDNGHWLTSADASTAAVYTKNIGVTFYSLEGGSPVERANYPAESYISEWFIANDGSRLIAYLPDLERLYIIDSHTGEKLSEIPVPERMATFVFTADAQRVAMTTEHPTFEDRHALSLYETSSGAEIDHSFADLDLIAQPAMMHSSSFVLTSTSGTATSQIRLTFSDGDDLASPPRSLLFDNNINGITESPDRKFCAVVMAEKIQVFDRGSLTEAAPAITRAQGGFVAATFAPDSRYLAITRNDGRKSYVRIWDWQNQVPISRELAVPYNFFEVDFSTDNTLIHIAASSARLSDPDSTTFLYTYEILPPADVVPTISTLASAISALSFSEDNTPEASNPFQHWQSLRDSHPSSWFIQPPLERSLSPRIDIAAETWLQNGVVNASDIFYSMPAVSASAAASAYLQLENLERERAQLDPSHPQSREALARLDQRQAELARLMHSAERNIDDSPLVATYLGKYHLLKGSLDAAESAFVKALQLDPDLITARRALGDLYLAKGDGQQAMQHFQKVLTADGDRVTSSDRYGLAISLHLQNQSARANAELLEIADPSTLAPSDQATLLLYLDPTAEQFASAAELLRRAARNEKHRNSLLSEVFAILAIDLTGEHQTARHTFAAATQRHPALHTDVGIRNLALSPILTDRLLTIRGDVSPLTETP